MARFNVPRAGRNQKEYEIKLITSMLNDERYVFRMGYGVFDMDTRTIINSFESVRSTYYKINQIKVHCIEIYIELNTKLSFVVEMADWLGRFLFGNGFQSYITVIRTENEYIIILALNAVSFKTGRLFRDNNACYYELYQIIRKKFETSLQIDVTENTFFDPEKPEGNYAHGTII